MQIAQYITDLTDAQWKLIEPMLHNPSKRGRPRTNPRRVINAIFYILKGGVQWRLLPTTFPPWQTVYHIFRKWAVENVWSALHNRLRALVRDSVGKRCRPTAAILDSQSVKSDAHGGEVGYDAAKCIKGRKRHLLVDTLGLILGVRVTPANVQDRAGAQLLLEDTLPWFSWLRKLWVDGAYTGDAFVRWVRELRRKR